MTERKRFDRELYAQYDQLAKDKTQGYLEAQGYTVSDHPNRYAQDLLFVDGMGQEYCAECEVKLVWNSMPFPYDTVQLPERKKKFFDRDTLFFIWNKPLTHAITFWSHQIKDLEPVEVPNRYVYKGEYFFQIPMAKTYMVGEAEDEVSS